MKTKLSTREKAVIIFSDIKRIEDLKVLTIRQLKALASRINKELGQVIVKALFGKVMSNMTKAELIAAIDAVRVCRSQTKVYSSELVAVTNRIYEYNYVGTVPGYDHWITYFGFNKTQEGSAEQNAEKFRQYLLKNKYCRLAAIRKSDRLKKFGFEFEVKVWGISNKILDCLVAKEKKAQEAKYREETKPFNEKTYEEQVAQLEAQLNNTVGLMRDRIIASIEKLGFEVINENKVVAAF